MTTWPRQPWRSSWRRISGSAARMQSAVPARLTASSRRHSSAVVSPMERSKPIPALHTSVSMRPKRAWQACTR